jgi:hypothetical protein
MIDTENSKWHIVFRYVFLLWYWEGECVAHVSQLCLYCRVYMFHAETMLVRSRIVGDLCDIVFLVLHLLGQF